MSLAQLTERQKIARLVASSMVFGLSVSFILGELVDHKARDLAKWQVAPEYFPREYSPLTPLKALADWRASEQWQNNLVAMNSLLLEAPPIATNSTNESLAVVAAPVPAVEDKIVTTHAAPVNVRPTPKVEPKEEINSVRTAIVAESIRVSIHEATTQVAGKVNVTPPPAPAQLKVVSEMMTVPRPAAEVPQSPEPPSADWLIQGKVHPLAGKSEGHFEVGLYNKVDSQGLPVGFPLAQDFLPPGQTRFKLKVPSAAPMGHLFGVFIEDKTGKKTWLRPVANPVARDRVADNDLMYAVQDSVSTVASSSMGFVAATKTSRKISGKVFAMFGTRESKFALADAVIKVRGRKEAARTDKFGVFTLDLGDTKGTILLEALKGGFHPTILSVDESKEDLGVLELASRDAIEQLARAINVRQATNKGVIVGRAANADGSAIKGMAANLSLPAEGPFYFNEGFISTDSKSTTADGRFIYFNVDPGVGLLEASVGGEAIVPFSVSVVDGGELVQKTITPVTTKISGRLFNPVAQNKGRLQPISGARVRIEGGTMSSVADSFGGYTIGPFKYASGEPVVLEVTANKYYNHRYSVSSDRLGTTSLDLFAFPAKYINELANSMDLFLDPQSGIVLGKVSGLSVRLDALADHAVNNTAKDFYFDNKGSLRGSHSQTHPKFGNYVIFNVPRGRAILNGNDSNGKLRYSDVLNISPSSVNVLLN